jgi:multisubunit Na+/H+ antiporter MnhB subunit
VRPGAHISAIAASRFCAPLIALFASLLLAGGVTGSGVGFAAGLAFALVIVLHALVFGAGAASQALAPPLARVLLALGVAASVAGGGLQGWRYAPQIMEAGVFVATVASAALAIQVVFGRASTMRDDAW